GDAAGGLYEFAGRSPGSCCRGHRGEPAGRFRAYARDLLSRVLQPARSPCPDRLANRAAPTSGFRTAAVRRVDIGSRTAAFAILAANLIAERQRQTLLTL